MAISQSELDLKRVETDAKARRGEPYMWDSRLNEEENKFLEHYHQNRIRYHRGESTNQTHGTTDHAGQPINHVPSKKGKSFRRVVLIVVGCIFAIWVIIIADDTITRLDRTSRKRPPEKIEGVDYITVTWGNAAIYPQPAYKGMPIGITKDGTPIDSYKVELENPIVKNGFTYISFRKKNLFTFFRNADKRYKGGWIQKSMLKTENLDMHTYLYRAKIYKEENKN